MNTYIFASSKNLTDKIAFCGNSIEEAEENVQKGLFSGMPKGFKLFSIEKKPLSEVKLTPYKRGEKIMELGLRM